MHGSSSHNPGESFVDKIKGAYSSVHGGLEVIRGNFNDTVDRAGDAVANRPSHSVESRSTNNPHSNPHSSASHPSTTTTTVGGGPHTAHNADVASRGLEEMNRGLEKMTGKKVGAGHDGEQTGYGEPHAGGGAAPEAWTANPTSTSTSTHSAAAPTSSEGDYKAPLQPPPHHGEYHPHQHGQHQQQYSHNEHQPTQTGPPAPAPAQSHAPALPARHHAEGSAEGAGAPVQGGAY